MNLSSALSTYGPSEALIDYVGDYADSSELKAKLENGFNDLISKTERKWVKFRGKFAGIEGLVMDCAEGFGFGVYKNNSEKKIRVRIINTRKHLDLGKAFNLIV